MKLKIKAGTTSRILRVFVQDTTSTSGAGLTGLAYNTANLKCYYSRVGASSATAVTLATATAGTFTSGGFVAIDGTNMPGVYELHIPNAAIASSATAVHVMLYGAANMAPVLIEIELDAVDYQDSGRMGLTALPAAAADGAGGLPVIGTNNNQFSSTLGKATLASASITTNVFQDGAITAAKFGSNALGAVWDELKSAHTTANTYGAYLDQANSAATADTAGTTTLLSRLSSTRAGYLDNLSGGAVALASGVSLSDGAITAAKIASDAITAAKIATGAITSAKFAAGAIDAAAIATGAIDADALATDAVTEIWSVAVPGAFASGTAAYVLGNIATGTPPTKEAVAAEVWATALPGSFTSGQAGYILPNISGGGGTDPWSVSLPGAYSAGTAGYIVGTNLNATVSSRSTYAGGDTAGTTTLLGRITSTRAGNLDYLDAAISSTASASALASVASDVDAIGVIVSSTGVVVAAGSKSGYSLSQSFPTNFASMSIDSSGRVVLAPAGLDAITVETGLNARQSLSVIAAAGGGVLSGAGTGTIVIKGANVSTTRITATTDSSGNRSSITLSPPS